MFGGVGCGGCGPDDQGVGITFDGCGAGFGKVGGPGLETVGKGGCCN